MLKLTFGMALAICISVTPMWAEGAAPAKKPATRKATAKPSATVVRGQFFKLMITQNTVIDSCEAAATHAKLAVSADEIERGISTHGTLKFSDLRLEKDEYETTDQFNERTGRQIQLFLANLDESYLRPLSRTSWFRTTQILASFLFNLKVAAPTRAHIHQSN